MLSMLLFGMVFWLLSGLAGFCIGRITAPRAKIVEIERVVDPDIGRRYQALEQLPKTLELLKLQAARQRRVTDAIQWANRQPWYQHWRSDLLKRREARDAAPDLINDPRYWALRASGKLWTKEGYAEVLRITGNGGSA